MNAWPTVLSVALIGAMAGGLFQLKHAVQRAEDDLTRVNRELLASQDEIHVLEAEWSYLNRPGRLSALASRHLELGPLTPGQIGGVEALPGVRQRDRADAGPKVAAVLAGREGAP